MEQFTVMEGETAVAEAGVWHDWWNASPRDVRVRVEITPRLRFARMIGSLGPIARMLGYRTTYPQLSRNVLAPRT